MSNISDEYLIGKRVRGRGTSSNPDIRFDSLATRWFDDGWSREEDLPILRTEVRDENPRKVISRNTSPDLYFDRSLNPYRGCEHGCVYCFARPSHAYLGLSPGLEFETQLIARPGAPEILEKELRAPRYRPATLAIGSNTDPYQPIEKERKIMRGCLEVLRDFKHPVAIVTKGSLIERDIDILSELASDGLVRVGISVTTLDAEISRKMEPRVPSPARRLKVVERLAEAGIDVRIMASPMIPALTDHELEAILRSGADAGARAASMIVLRLPREVASLFREWVETNFPDRAARIMGRVRELHGGRDYDPQWGQRMRGQGQWAELMQKRFARALRQFGLDKHRPALRTDLFSAPARVGDQLSLF